MLGGLTWHAKGKEHSEAVVQLAKTDIHQIMVVEEPFR